MHNPRLEYGTDALSLANCVEPEPSMFSYSFSGFSVDHEARRLPKVVPQEIVELELTEETYALFLKNQQGNIRTRERKKTTHGKKVRWRNDNGLAVLNLLFSLFLATNDDVERKTWKRTLRKGKTFGCIISMVGWLVD